MSYSSVEHHKAQISGIFTYFMNNKKISRNICLNTTIPKTEEEKMQDTIIDNVEDFEDTELYEDEKFITPEQAVQVLNLFMNTPMMLPVCLATFMSLRRSEIAGILKNKVDKEHMKLTINASRVRCGNKTIYKKRNKNKTSTRNLYIPKIMLNILEADEKRQEKMQKEAEKVGLGGLNKLADYTINIGESANILKRIKNIGAKYTKLR